MHNVLGGKSHNFKHSFKFNCWISGPEAFLKEENNMSVVEYCNLGRDVVQVHLTENISNHF